MTDKTGYRLRQGIRGQGIRGRAAFAALLAFLLVAAGLAAPASADEVVARQGLDIDSVNGPHHFNVEVATDDATRARGLMFRRAIGAGEGMLFLYDEPRAIQMWMKDTFVPLDMVFIGVDGRVSHVHPLAEPLSEAVISSNGEVQGVLEIKGGLAAELGIGVGDKVLNPTVKLSAP